MSCHDQQTQPSIPLHNNTCRYESPDLKTEDNSSNTLTHSLTHYLSTYNIHAKQILFGADVHAVFVANICLGNRASYLERYVPIMYAQVLPT